MGLEYLFARLKKKNYFNFNSSIANINVGIAERLLDTFTVGAFYYFYQYLHQHFALFDIKPSILLWIVLLLATDFIWYWYHRLAHEVNILWSVHVVHHQSEEFNYTASVRITVLQALVRTGFWSVLPILGFPAEMITALLLVHGAYPFFTHTRMIGKLGFLEYILVTPSHHRVHHASNEAYLDKNYGDVFIIWDKLFGTFAEEKEEPIYGLTKPIGSYSFLWQHFHFLLELLYAVKMTSGWKNKLKLIFGRPDLINPDYRAKLEKIFLFSKTNKIPTTQRFRNYVIAQITFTLVFLFSFLLLEHYIPLFYQIVSALFILITLINCGAILERRGWVFHLEYIRIFLLFAAFYFYIPNLLVLFVFFILTLYLIFYFTSLQRRYLRLVYR
jgi:sterol desaturase/sphingolipid hydroxylase (fatty acid hydroxylase superfamily)